MQLKNITLYKDTQNIRVLPFQLGMVNIITGESKSGKTALIDIVDYCLGSNSCNIAEGVIKDNVHWFAITIVLEKEEFFIARLNPNKRGVQSVVEVYIEEGPFSAPPAFESIVSNSNITNLKEFLSKKINIAENLQSVETLTRNALEVNFKHARIFCFQPQGLIAQRDLLFYNQSDSFASQAIKDSLPYFLGAVREDTLIIEQQIAQKRRELSRLNREKNESENIRSEGISKCFSLIEEAKEIGILDSKTIVDNVGDALSKLNSIKEWEYRVESMPTGENSAIKELIDKRSVLREKLGDLEDTMSATQSFVRNNFSYSDEMDHHRVRLESIQLFNESDNPNDFCPLCSSKLQITIPSVSAIQRALTSLNESLQSTVREKPRLNNYLKELGDQCESTKEDISKIEQSIAALYAEKEAARTLRDLNIRRGKVIGRVSLFLESVDFVEDTSLNDKITQLKSEIETLGSSIDKETKEERLISILSKINAQMTKWVEKLDVEYNDSPIRFDPNKLTIFADTVDKPVSLLQMGSGANWVAYHLLVHFALHQHFIQASRPVPRFLMLDQPSQVYFPPAKDINNTGEITENADEKAVREMFEFIVDATTAQDGKLQTIVMDHAFLKSEKFSSHVIEVWRDGLKLIPESWYKVDTSTTA